MKGDRYFLDTVCNISNMRAVQGIVFDKLQGDWYFDEKVCKKVWYYFTQTKWFEKEKLRMQIRFFFSQNINFLCILLLKMSFRKKYQIDYYFYSTVINFYWGWKEVCLLKLCVKLLPETVILVQTALGWVKFPVWSSHISFTN